MALSLEDQVRGLSILVGALCGCMEVTNPGVLAKILTRLDSDPDVPPAALQFALGHVSPAQPREQPPPQ